MQYVKVVGSLLIFLASYTVAREMFELERRKIRQLDSFIRLIKHIRSQIDCFCMPVADILKQCSDDIIINCEVHMRGDSFDALLENCTILSGENVRMLLHGFSSELGKSYRDEQVKGCDYYISALSAERDSLAFDIDSKKKTIYTLLICTSAAIILFII